MAVTPTEMPIAYMDGYPRKAIPVALLNADNSLASAGSGSSGPNPAQDGTDATGVSAPSGAAGIRGWLSGIYARLGGTLAVAGINAVGQAPVNPVPVSGVDSAGLKQHLRTDTFGTPTDAPVRGGAGSMIALLRGLIGVEQPIQGVIAMTVGTAITAQRGVRIKCTAAGNVSLVYADGSTDVIPVNVGVTETMGAITTIATSGTTATATYSALV